MLRDGSSGRARPIRSRHRVPSLWLRSMIGWDGSTTPSACSRTARRSGGTPLRSAFGSACPTLSLAAKSRRRQSLAGFARSHRNGRCRARNAIGLATSRRSFRTASPPCRANTASPKNDRRSCPPGVSAHLLSQQIIAYIAITLTVNSLPCFHPDRPIPPPARRSRAPVRATFDAAFKYLIQLSL